MLYRNHALFCLTWLRLMLLVSIVFSLSACSNLGPASYRNPGFDCPTSEVVEADDDYPQPVKQYPYPPDKKSIAALQDFCSRMNRRFAKSNLTDLEAEQLYRLFEANGDKSLPDGNSLQFNNGCYGMPVCTREPFSMEKQVKLRKVTNNEYEVFYYRIECGTNFIHMQIKIEQNEIQSLTWVEMWSESFPC